MKLACFLFTLFPFPFAIFHLFYVSFSGGNLKGSALSLALNKQSSRKFIEGGRERG